MPEHDLHTFMSQITSDMASEYERIYARAAEDPGTAGDQGEENWATLFRDWLPATYHVQTKGRLISHDGRMSPQVDVVVLKPNYPKKLLEKKTWLAGGVAAAFECKTTLTAAHVTESVRRCAAFKELFAPRSGTPRTELRSPLIYGLLAHSHSWKGPNSDPVGNVQRALDNAAPSVSHPRLEMDVLCVADLATWRGMIMTRYEASWSPQSIALNKAFGAPYGPITSMNCSSLGSDNQTTTFQPVGALIEKLTKGLAWEDPSARDLADYFRLTHMGGSGMGNMRPWPLTTYSPEVASEIAKGSLKNGGFWDDWSLAGT
ncbi:Uncharacterised protein [Brevundimonas diminuta]|jgi:hypothetical protein|nr:Uncharacterised protein [Brevundimonas diminuta]SUW15856.1 Uncharacterised protein [Brevundimonas diminuta]